MPARRTLWLLAAAVVVGCAAVAVAAPDPLPPIELPFGFVVSRDLSLGTLLAQAGLAWVVVKHAGVWGWKQKRSYENVQLIPDLKATVDKHLLNDTNMWRKVGETTVSTNETVAALQVIVRNLCAAVEALKAVDEKAARDLAEHKARGKLFQKMLTAEIRHPGRTRRKGKAA